MWLTEILTTEGARRLLSEEKPQVHDDRDRTLTVAAGESRSVTVSKDRLVSIDSREVTAIELEQALGRAEIHVRQHFEPAR